MDFLELLKVILIGIVEGVTEWLPISSTGHMILLNEFIKLDVTDAFWTLFKVVIQLGAIFAVVVIFWNDINPFMTKKALGKQQLKGFFRIIQKDKFVLWMKILVSCLPAAVIGLLFDDQFEAMFYNYVSVSIALIVFGVAFIVIENSHKGKKATVNSLAELTYKTAIIIGLFQVIAAIFPGTSRSGATIVGALLIGVSRTVAAEFTFFLAIPVMFGASLLKIVKFGFVYSQAEVMIMIVGLLVSFVVSIVVIKFLMSYIKKHDFKIFGWYRIALGILVLAYFGLKG